MRFMTRLPLRSISLRTIARDALSVAADTIATLGFFYIALAPAAYAGSLTIAGVLYIVSSTLVSDVKAIQDGLLVTLLMATYWALSVVVYLAIGLEVIRRVIGRSPLWLYTAGGLVAAMFHLHLDAISGFKTVHALMIALFLLSGAMAGSIYWLVAIKLRAVLTNWLRRAVKRLPWETETCAVSCAFC
jgi:hypothetical protein